MARRPTYIPDPTARGKVREVGVEFTWHAGMSVSQKQKSIASLHEEVRRTLGVAQVLEISSKSPERLGVELSAFNLSLKVGDTTRLPVEVVFQGSKVFKNGGPFVDLYSVTSREAKKDMRLSTSGSLVRFEFCGEKWPLLPRTIFYDWLYINALKQNAEQAERVLNYEAFTDIEFNPEKSINCQARSAALFVALHRCGKVADALESSTSFIHMFEDAVPPEQLSLLED